MSDRLVPRPPRLRRWQVFSLLLIPAVTAVGPGTPRSAPATDTDARIRFYTARIGGPATYQAFTGLAVAYLQKSRETGDAGHLKTARKHLVTSMGFQPSFEALRALSFLAVEEHEFGAALKYATQALEAVPSDIETKGILFDAYSALGDRVEAERLLHEMLASGDSFAALSRLSALRFLDRDVAGAVAAMQRACVHAEREARPADNRAWCHVKLGTHFAAICDTVSAEQEYQRALRYLPTYPYALRQLAALRAPAEIAVAESEADCFRVVP